MRYLWLAKALIMREEEEQLFCDLFQILEKEFGSKFLLVNDIWRAPATALFKEFNHFFFFYKDLLWTWFIRNAKTFIKNYSN
jgi:hypothetical protein